MSRAEPPSNKWMTTFADLLSLMLTFFILLFSMSEVKRQEWEELTSSLKGRLNPDAAALQMDTPDAPSPPRIDLVDALSLSYLKQVLEGKLTEMLGEEVRVAHEGDQLRIKLSSDALFRPSSSAFSIDGMPLVRVVANAVSKLPNRVTILGHTDPRPIQTKEYPSNWELSMSRAYAVAMLLRNAGYDKPLNVYGMASGQYDTIDTASYPKESTRFRLARRIDIVIMEYEE